MTYHGQCLCKAVSLSFERDNNHAEACHCEMCRTWGGGPLLCVDAGTGIRFEGADFIAVYGSSEWAQRGFCRQCGTHLFYHLLPTDGYTVPVGLLAEQDTLQLHRQIFVDSKPELYDFANDTPRLTGEQVIAEFTQQLEAAQQKP